jgi:putative ABC transport system permease protein
MGYILQDLRLAVRSLFKSPGFVIAAVLVIALGIGANTAIFSVVNAVLLRPLPFENPDQLVVLYHTPPQKSFPGMTRFSVSPANYYDWKSMSSSFQQTAIYGFKSFNLTGVDKPENVVGAGIEPSFFSVFGIQPMIGRGFSTEEDQPGHEKVVVLSHRFWKERFNSDPGVVGRTVDFDGEKYSVVGVMPESFARPSWADVWTPLALKSTERSVRGMHDYLVIGRLKPGVTIQQANTDLATVSNKLAQAYPEDDNGWGAMAVSLREDLIGDVRPALMMLLGSVMFVLLIACANVANLLLARTLSRKREVAIRVALGATRRRLLQQVLAESVFISVVGGVVGLVLAHFGIKLVVSFLANSLPRHIAIGLDGTVLMFTFAVAVLTGIVVGILPAFKFADADVNETLKQGSGRSGTESGGLRTRAVLVVAEVSLSLMLLVGAGLMVRTLYNLQHTDAGFDTTHTVTMSLAANPTAYKSTTQQAQAVNEIERAVRAVPGVEDAGVVDSLPLTGGSHQPIQAEGHPVVQMSDQPEVAVRTASPGYFRAMRIPLLKGRNLSDTDTDTAPGAILISEALAKRIWPNQEPIGKHLTLTFAPQRVREVVGVVGDVKLQKMSSSEPDATLYVPLAQADVPKGFDYRPRPMSLVVRSSTKPANVVSGVTNAVHSVDAGMPILDIYAMNDFIAETLTSERMNMTLLVAFAALALTLAAIGIYSVLAYAVRRRVREIGIRMALGAQASDILRLVVLQGLKPVTIGIAIGLVLSLALGRAVASLIYGVRPTDALTLTLGALLLVLVSTAATLIPAYRATKVVPVTILREE